MRDIKIKTINKKVLEKETIFVKNSNLREKLLNSVFVSFGFLACVYVFILGNMVFYIIEKKNLENETKSLVNDINDLEFSYLSSSSNIDKNYAESLGYKNIKSEFAIRKTFGFYNTSNDLKN